MRITLVGAGAIGSLWALKLHQAGHYIHVWTRDFRPTIELGLKDGTKETFSSNNVQLLLDSDCILFCVKIFQVVGALDAILPYLNLNALVIFMYNGMGISEAVLTRLGTTPVILATTAQASFKLSKVEIKHNGIGETRLGGVNDAGKQYSFIADVFHHALAPCFWEEEIKHALWRKLAINCLINPLSALNQIANGELIKKIWHKKLEQLSGEFAEVARKEKINLSKEEILELSLAVARATANNYCSMNRDVFFKRPSEIDFITGYLISRAKYYSIHVPLNVSLYQEIKNLECSYDKRQYTHFSSTRYRKNIS
ncbi:2-dehydropantoate 2-reductase [Candidatus Enterovibrio escicola]|uniref:2-dehydropantoate 2-reductase n=1 Tax=Candidatus Enterovibrio escicola TaxID=1927127 RepID=A0A2A5T5Q2_9GAMM|nr:2-dehydropantoate 2-reductase [Candidatus Enterovibrio escacola]PCS23471.1 2-dehydropantoate 2-reductase [Candidatus Enterovibrio escacola]